MKMEELFEMENNINDIEKEIDINTKDFIKKLNRQVLEFETNYNNFIVTCNTNNKIAVKIYDYEFVFKVEEGYFIPKTQFQELDTNDSLISLKTIANNEEFAKYYCSYISVYFINPRFDKETYINADNIYINKNYEIAMQGNMKYTYFDTKEEIFNNFENILINIFNRVYDLQISLPNNNELMKKILI